ncbi:hypothetical protein N7495_001382 [Penicillium taxi]|uniref:uncharacterized protein n=1 Tax=Penicillium taxi TaxID=168475 RepID=UPI0025457DB9|nr:uncharacterized protein N7495_001382 [Penicillium taxi]KAJ5908700.1 hypothetical protein N7495_001382 [Penicillium taxi]
MVLRKQPPPRLDDLGKWNARSESNSPTSSKSPIFHRRARLNPIHSEDSIYSPDLNTSPAFDLMPLEDAQRSPVGSPSSHMSTSWAEAAEDHPATLDGPYSAGTAETKKEWLPQKSPLRSRSTNDNTMGDQFQSKNPFLKRKPVAARTNSSDTNDWKDRNSQITTNGDGLSPSEGFIPMTARLSLLDEPEESSWERSIPQVKPPIPDYQTYELSPSESQHSIKISAPREIYLEGQANTYAPAVVVQPSEQSDTYGPLPSYGHDILGSEAGSRAVSAVSSGTSATSHELIDLDTHSNLGVETGTQIVVPSILSSDGVSRNGQNISSGLLSHSSLLDNQQFRPPSIQRPKLSPADEARQREQRSETYSIRQINWTDRTGNLIQSPILVQNENGPCPLLALINALVLRADSNSQSPIVRALSTREQISLGLLIEALFEELITCLGPDQEFPDIEDLSQFLTMLHTGMNVNPSLTLESADSLGTFLQTSDLRLYSTFGVPIIHGWISSWSSPAHAAMTRAGNFHEDIQLLPFRKQELEDRIMRGESLTTEEEQQMADIQEIQGFVEFENATQLSPFGLTQLSTRLAPGSVSILFRNDHFSTLYKHPQSHQLYTLVTDAGYAEHAEVVWESLVDVTGFNAEFLSGDFRVVSHGPSGSDAPAGPRTSSVAATLDPVAAAAETEQGRLSPQEQADADYAYALSLQFQEEEERERTENENGNGNQESPQTSGPRASPPTRPPRPPRNEHSPTMPPRPRNQPSPAMTSPHVRSSSTPNNVGSYSAPQMHINPDDDHNAPPPPYEQATSGPRYSPPDRRPQYGNAARDQYAENGNRHSQQQHPQQQRYQNQNRPDNPDRNSDRDRRNSKDCIVM